MSSSGGDSGSHVPRASAASAASVSPGRRRQDALTGSFLSMVDEAALHVITASQAEMLERFERTNQMLTSFNELSLGRFRQLHGEFRAHQQTLEELRKDLDLVFKRINSVKRLTERQHPDHFAASAAVVAELGVSRAASEADLPSAAATATAVVSDAQTPT